MEELEVSMREGKRDLTTLDLLHSCTSIRPKDVALGLRTFDCHSHLPPLDLNLLPGDGPEPAAGPGARSQSVCTIEKVKRALERAERESRGREEQRPRQRVRGEGASAGFGSPTPSPSSSSITTASTKRRAAEGQEGGEEASDGCNSAGGGSGLVAAGCPGCLSYVLISKREMRCPRCESQVPLTVVPRKRARLDLNFSL